MWMVAAYRGLTGQVGWLGLRVGGHLALSLHLSNEPGELLQWPHHDYRNINIVIGIKTTKVLTNGEFDCILIPLKTLWDSNG